ncbi:MAG TPA: PLD nuclease N-terminal domain-containing protein [Tepidisphaeraceae bacterium]
MSLVALLIQLVRLAHLLREAQQLLEVHMNELMLLAQSNSGVAAGGAVVMVLFVVAAIASIFWLWMLIDCLVSNMPVAEKVLWAVVILFLHLLGAIIYFFVARKKNRNVVV